MPFSSSNSAIACLHLTAIFISHLFFQKWSEGTPVLETIVTRKIDSQNTHSTNIQGWRLFPIKVTKFRWASSELDMSTRPGRRRCPRYFPLTNFTKLLKGTLIAEPSRGNRLPVFVVSNTLPSTWLKFGLLRRLRDLPRTIRRATRLEQIVLSSTNEGCHYSSEEAFLNGPQKSQIGPMRRTIRFQWSQ